MGIDWNNLKENKEGKSERDKWKNKGLEFEKLALNYLRDNFTIKWDETNITRDGNKDAVSTVIHGKEEIWAEAKFTKKTRLSRYRLDATIVSAIIYDKKIIKIIFITNSEIDDKTQIDIERALKNSLGIRTDVLFRTKYDIEFWLYNNPQRYIEHFNDNIQSLNKLNFNSIIANNISFYKSIRQSFYFRESLNELYIGNTYELIFSVFSPFDQKDCEVRLNTNLIQISPRKIDLKQGGNRICLTCFGLKPGHLPNHLITICDCPIKTSKSVYIKKENIHIEIKSQKGIAKFILKSFAEFKKDPITCIHVINGIGGIGKTTLLENLIQNEVFKDIDIIYQSMSKDKIESYIIIINIILALLFYHVEPSMIDRSFLDSIKQYYLSSTLKNLVSAKYKIDKEKNPHNIENLNERISDYNNSPEIFSNNIELNKKVLILDDLHKLAPSGREFLFHFLEDLVSSKTPCFIILCGRSLFCNSDEYKAFKQHYPISVHNYQYGTSDLYENLIKYNYNVNKQIISILAEKMDISVFSTKALLDFLLRNKDSFDSRHADSCHAMINYFISEDQYPKSVIERFNALNDEERNIITLVYFSYSGIDKGHIKRTFMPIFNNLELNGLLKTDNNKYIPYHDIYKEIYNSSTTPLSSSAMSLYLKTSVSKLEIVRDELLYHKMDVQQKNELLHIIMHLIAEHQFYTVLYILDPVFSRLSHEESQINENRINYLGLTLYYNLKFYYIYAATNCSKSIGGNLDFEQLYKEIKDLLAPDIKLITLKVLAELINSRYEHLSLSASNKFSRSLKKIVYNLEREGHIKTGQGQYNPSFILAKEIDILTNVIQDQYTKAKFQQQRLNKLCLAAKDYNKIAIISIRHSRLMLHRDIDHAYDCIAKAVSDLKARNSTERKWILIGEFELCFINIIRGYMDNVKELKIAHDRLEKDFNNDYNRGSLIVAACYIYWGLPKEAYMYLYKDYFTRRQLNPRCEAIRYGLLALYEYIFNKNKENAIACLNKQKHIFRKLGASYHIVIDHNIRIITSTYRIRQVDFYTNNKILADRCLYVDPRIW